MSEIEPFEVRKVGDARLRRRATPVQLEDEDPANFIIFLERLVASMRSAGGVGIAANQVGDPRAVFAMEISMESLARTGEEVCEAQRRRHLPLCVVVNPALTPVGCASVEWFEGCLSCPGYVGLVPRHEAVLLTGTDPGGAPLRLELEGWAARIAQHEIDHLDGRVYVDRIDTRTFITRDAYEDQWRHVPVGEFKAAVGIGDA